MSTHQVAYAQKRRSTRIDQSVPVAVQGLGAYREPYQEQVSTVAISCHGCAYESKNEVIRGEVVYLDVRSTKDGSTHGSSRARVKWVHNLGPGVGFQVAVELEVAGNIWGIETPPQDWFAPQAPAASELAAAGRELRVVTRAEQPMAPAADRGSVQSSRIERTDVAASPFSSLAPLMAGLGEQMQIMASEAAKIAIADQKSKLLDEFRSQLRREAIKAMQAVILASKEDFTRLALKELNEAHEAGARATYARWMEKIGQDMESGRQHMMVQAKEVSQRLEGLSVSTIEQVQRNMEASRAEAVDRFVLRLREQVAPMLGEAKDALQTLAASGAAFKKESQEIYAGLEGQIESSANTSLAKVHDELDKSSAGVAAKTTETLLRLSQDFDNAAREHLQSLLTSMEGHVTKTLQEKTAQITREFSAGLENFSRNYLEFIGKSIAEIPKKLPGRPTE